MISWVSRPSEQSHADAWQCFRSRRWLHNTSFFAVAQKKYVYIYDSNGLEIHQLRNHIEVNRMQFLRYHFLLATVVSGQCYIRPTGSTARAGGALPLCMRPPPHYKLTTIISFDDRVILAS